MKKVIILVLAVSACVSSCFAQSIWSKAHLDSVRTHLDRPMYAAAYKALKNRADALLDVKPLSVMDKQRPAPGGDNHDYTSLARYFHPSPDGGAYVERDGVTNPEIALYDRTNLGTTAGRITNLALAYYLGGEEKYARKAVELLRTWFLNPATAMNPNMNYAQMVPGVNDSKGRPFGVLDSYSFVDMLEGVALLNDSEAWTKADRDALKAWMSEFLDWMLTSEQGVAESNMANNHSTAYDAEVMAIAMYVDRHDVARKVASEFPERRIFTQIEPSGMQPHEMWRTLSFGYSQYNLTHYIDIFLMAQKLGLMLDKSENAEGRSFYKAMDLMASYLGKTPEQWPGKQISDWEGKQQLLAKDLWRVYSRIDSSREDYADSYRKYRNFEPSDIFTLLYYTPTATDDAYTSAGQTLRYAVELARKAKAEPHNIAGGNVSPRTLDADGNLVLVHPHDWTSGFFPGQLWMMYEFTRNPYWAERAAEFTLPIELAKTHCGTHDLGFMMDNSFGKGYTLTADSSYFDVVHESSKTLCTRFSPVVGAIRSWDHNAQVWHYPVIIDNMMNLEMLFKMTMATGDSTFHNIAVRHADTTLANHFRPDGSTYHVVDYDPETGNVRMKVTAQGYADDSFWSRGQAWAIYGFTMCYRYTGDRRYLDQAVKTADWWLSLSNMPSDGIPFWDMKAPGTDVQDNPEVPRDASAAAIIASAFYELDGYVPGKPYRAHADMLLANLTKHYTAKEGPFILTQSTGHHPGNSEINVPLVYADYYYLEAMARSGN